MANEFKIKKGLIVTGASGGTVVDIQGSQGQLFSVTDDLSGSIFAVSDISGVPILDVNSSGLVTVDGPFTQTGGGATILSGTLNVAGVSTLANVGYLGDGLGSVQYTFQSANDGFATIDFGDVADSNIGRLSYSHVDNSFLIRTNNATALTLDSSQNATFAGDVTVSGGDITVSNAITGISGGSFRVKNNGGTTIATFADDLSATFAAQAFATTATSSGNASSTLTTKGYVDSLITGATIYRGAWQAGISATSSAATTASTTLTVTAAILDADGNTPVLVGAVVTGEGITGIVKVASVTSSTVYVLDTAIDATATAYIFSPIYGAPSLDGVTQTSGYYYICSEAGSATPNGANSEPNTWNVGDWCIYNDVSGTGQWQKIDNSSVLSGAGTGQTVALWEGPSSVSDSDTLGNAPITVSGSDTIFAGTVEAATYYKSSGTSAVLGTNASGEVLLRPTSSISSTAQSSFTTTLATIGTEATFAGPITAEFAASSAMLNLYNTTNGNGSTIRFSDQTAQTQVGDITFYHSDGSSQGGGASWHFTSQPDTVLVVGSSTVTGRFVAKSAGSATEVDYGFYDDVNTGMYRAAADTLAFSTAGTERMRINSAGAIKFNAYGAGTLVTDASGNITVSSGGGAGGPYLPLAGGTMTGNVIFPGEEANSFKIAFTGASASSGISTVDQSGAGLYIGANSRVNASGNVVFHDTLLPSSGIYFDGWSGDDMEFYTGSSGNPTKRLTIEAGGDAIFTGNVGIGVTDPASKLEVAGVVTIKGSGTGTSGSLAIQDDYDNDNHLANIGWIRSSGGVYLSYGLKQDGSADWKSTYANFSGERTYAKLDNNEFSMSYAPAQNTAVGTVVTNITEKFKFYLNTGVLQLNSYSAGILSTNSSGTVGIASSGDLPGGPYLPLSAGSGERVTGDLYIDNNLYMRPSSTYGDGYKVMDVTGTGNAPYPTILSFSNYGRSSVMVLNDDKVGIGTTTPGSKLELSEVSGAAPTLLTLHQTAVDIVADDTMGSFIDFKSTDVNANFTPQARIGMLIRDSNGDNGIISEGCGNLVFHTSRGTDSAGAGEDVERMRITDIGNVGIGTSTPNAKLDVQGTQGQLFSVTDDLSGDIFSVADISGVPIMNVNSSGVSYFDGSLGIGTTSPDGQLDVTDGNSKMVFDGASSDRPLMYFQHNAVPVNGEEVGLFDFRGYNSASQDTRYAIWTAKAEDVTDGTEDGSLQLMTMKAGTATTTLTGRSGKVGIANANPAQALDVTGKIRVTDDIILAQTNGRIDYDNGVSTGALRFFSTSGNTERMRISSAGNVGIGTTGPGAKLHVADDTNFTSGQSSVEVVKLQRINTGGDIKASTEGHVSMWATDSNNDTEWARMSWVNDNANDGGLETEGALSFWTSQEGTLNRAMYIDHNQNVGIGTTSPDEKLSVDGNIFLQGNDDYIAFNTSASSGHPKIKMNSDADFSFLNTAGSNIFHIENGGNVGIGTAIPSYLLDVRDGTLSGAIARFSAVNAHVIIESSTAGPAVLHLKPNVTGNKSGQFKVTTGEGYNFRWSNDAASTAEVTYMKLDTSTTGGGDLTVKGDIIAYGAPSDERYKENIKPIESALDKALKLQGVTFDWKESDSILDIKEDIGFIAQDVQKVIPELVRENEDGKLSLRYQGVTPILLEAIKELKAEIEELKKQIK